jgi:hypothetical protein
MPWRYFLSMKMAKAAKMAGHRPVNWRTCPVTEKAGPAQAAIRG